MFKNRRLTVLILIFTVASVFLFSCGIALPINLTTNISGSVGAEESVININVKSTNDINFEMVKKGPSLILVYMVTEETDLTNEIDFKTNAEMNHLNEDYWEDAVYPLFDPQNCVNPLFEYTNKDNDVTTEMYAFQPVLEGEKITNNFDYYLNFNDPEKNYIHAYRIQDSEGNGIVIPVKFDSENATITIAGEDSFYVTAYNPESDFTQHVYVFAAITAQGLNNYVSDLTYVGEFN